MTAFYIMCKLQGYSTQTSVLKVRYQCRQCSAILPFLFLSLGICEESSTLQVYTSVELSSASAFFAQLLQMTQKTVKLAMMMSELQLSRTQMADQ